VPGDHYTVLLDPTFTEEEVQSALTGVDDLTGKIPELSLPIALSACVGTHPGVICVHRGMRPDIAAQDPYKVGYTETYKGVGGRGDTGGVLGTDGGEVWIGVAMVAELLPEYPLALPHAFEHELGHALGLKHHVGAMMNADYKGASMTATCDDVAQYYYVRYQVAPTCKE
jgi:hypothetical protein